MSSELSFGAEMSSERKLVVPSQDELKSMLERKWLKKMIQVSTSKKMVTESTYCS